MSYWSKLSMKDKADVMRIFLDKGISDLDTIRREYNIFAEGGDTNDNDLVDWIIREEGFNSKPENIGDGKITLGSGLTDKKWHDLYRKRGNKWSEADNRMAVAEEVANRRRWAEKNIPNWDTLPDSAQKALLSYKYNYNFTSANSPKLFQALADSNLYEAAKQMDATSKDPKFKKGLMDRRKREQEWFLSDVTGNATPTQVIPVQAPVTINTSMIPLTEPAVSTAVRNNYVPATTTPYNRGNNMRRTFESAVAFNRMMNATSLQNNPLPEYQFPIEYAEGGKIHIDPSKKGTFTAAASRHGMGVQEFASRVLANKENYSPAMVKKANFARNASKWHGFGGNLYEDGGDSNNPKPITTGGAGYIPSAIDPHLTKETIFKGIRRRLYDNINPRGYNNAKERLFNALILNKKEPGERFARDDMFATYLQIPQNERHNIKGKVTISKSNYSPKGADPQKETYKIDNLSNRAINVLLSNAGQLEYNPWEITHYSVKPEIGKNRQLKQKDVGGYTTPELDALGEFTLGRGFDNKGEYISYFDSYDLGDSYNSPYTDQSKGVGKPFNIYDRIYLDDYYGMPNEYRGSSYLPEVTVIGKRKKKYGLGGNLFEGGGSYSYTKPLDNVFVDEYGNLLDPNVPSARGTVQLPEVIATTRDPRKYSSAYDKYLGFGDALYDLSRNVMLRGHSWGIGDGTEKISLPSDSISNEPFEGIAQATYLLPRDLQDAKFKDAGYTRSDGDYGLVKRAVGSNNVPVYQKRPDDISRDKLVPIGNINDIWLGKEEAELVHPGSYPTTIYIDPETNDLYQKGWDYNNYGSSDNGGGAAKYYSGLKKYAANALDLIGSPVVVTTGFSKIGNINNLDDYSKVTLDDYGILDSYRKKNTSSSNIRKQKHGPSK